MATHICYEKPLHKKLLLNFLTNHNRNTIGYCSHNSREQMKNPETFSNEAQTEFLMKIVYLLMTNNKDGIFWHFRPLFGKIAQSVRKGFSNLRRSAKFYMLVIECNNKLEDCRGGISNIS